MYFFLFISHGMARFIAFLVDVFFFFYGSRRRLIVFTYPLEFPSTKPSAGPKQRGFFLTAIYSIVHSQMDNIWKNKGTQMQH